LQHCQSSASKQLPWHLCREEEFYDREQLFGRDVSSVFPNQAQDGNAMDAIKEAIGAKKFISETEVWHPGLQLS
jgi:hypothetical protein